MHPLPLLHSATALVIFIITSSPSASVTALSFSPQGMACLVNKERLAAGVPPVGVDNSLVSAAQKHSSDMARMNRLEHTGSDGSSPGSRADKAGFNYKNLSENISFGQQSMEAAMQAFMNSPDHQKNLLDPKAQMMGAGFSMSGGTPYFTQNFGSDGRGARNIPSCNGGYDDSYGSGQPDASYGGGDRRRGSGGDNGRRQLLGNVDLTANLFGSGGDGGDGGSRRGRSGHGGRSRKGHRNHNDGFDSNKGQNDNSGSVPSHGQRSFDDGRASFGNGRGNQGFNFGFGGGRPSGKMNNMRGNHGSFGGLQPLAAF